MLQAQKENRGRLVDAALRITCRYGFGEASIADIAEEARIPVGNVYYYFKTKDEIGGAVVERRVWRLKKLLRELDKEDSPKNRLCGFVQIKVRNREELARSGCPVGTLCSELRKQSPRLAAKAAAIFTEALAWLETQFRALGKGADSRGLALHLLSATQGVSLLAHAFHDPRLIDIEAARLKRWIRSL
ncbi:MAG TPA: TetR/AcrR family transcriptional regulator [Methylomirabilota bacterium]|nr:TetR/AcrR family transcriptional regulator [Methylomirabilota bacterium]